MNNIDLNVMWQYVDDVFTIEEIKQFYRDAGYSLGGFDEIFEEYR